MLSRRLGVLFVTVLLQQQVGAGGQKRVRQLPVGDHRNTVAVLGTKPTKEVEHLAGLADGLPDIAKRVSELLEAAVVASDVHVALNEIAKLGLQIHGAVELVVSNCSSMPCQMTYAVGLGTRTMARMSLATEL
jgi:hypothetical protein